MDDDDARSTYRDVVDALVRECLSGQGTVLPGWARRGRWQGAEDPGADETEGGGVAAFVAELSSADRERVAWMLRQAYAGGVHDTLRVIDDHEVAFFATPYEGASYQDFVGRLGGDWEWPT